MYATAHAVTNGMSGPTLTVPDPADTLNRNNKFDFCAKSYIVIEYMYICILLKHADLILTTFTTQLFTASGIMLAFMNDVSKAYLVMYVLHMPLFSIAYRSKPNEVFQHLL